MPHQQTNKQTARGSGISKKKKKGADKRINEMCFMIYLRATLSLEKDEIVVTCHDVNEP